MVRSHFELAADQWIVASLPAAVAIEVHGVFVERTCRLRPRPARLRQHFLTRHLVIAILGEAMRDVLCDVEARDLVLASRNTAWLCFSLKIATSTSRRRLRGGHRTAPGTTARCRTRWMPSVGLHHALILARLDPRRGVVDVRAQFLGKPAHVGAAGLEDLAHPRRIEDGEQQVLDSQEFVPRIARLREKRSSDNFPVRTRAFFYAPSGLFERAHQRMLVVTRIPNYLGYLGSAIS